MRRAGYVRDLVTLVAYSKTRFDRLVMISDSESYFGETLEQDCGHCGWCRSGRITIPPRNEPAIDESLLPRISEAVSEKPQVLGRPRVLARFLCGIPSPGISRAKLGKHPLAGAMTEVPFQRVLQWLEANL